MVNNLTERLRLIAPERRPWLIAAATMIVAVTAGMMWYASRPDWRTLFSGLESKDMQQVESELAAAGVTYQLTPDGGSVQVPAEALDKARMEVAAKGMPQSGRLGFELFDKPNWVGSEFDERVNYQRALEGELEHTIGTLSIVRSARVHLALPEQSLFAQDQKQAKASVVLHLRRTAMPPDEADQIRNLVAGAVENLSPDQVTLVDADGRTNLQKHSASVAEADAEEALEAKLVAMLEPMAGPGNVRASVNISYDQASEEKTDEIYDPTLTGTLSLQKNERTTTPPQKIGGVPGTASNAPAPSAAGAVAGSATAASPNTPPLLQKPGPPGALPVYPDGQSGASQTEKEETGTYAVTKHVVHTEAGPGRLRRVTAAVVVNDRETADATGKAPPVWRPRSADEMKRLEELAQAAVGFDVKRGDQVVMQNVSFSSNMPEPKVTGLAQTVEEAKGILHTQPGVYRTGMLGLLGLLLVFFVLRPLTGQVVASLKDPLALPAASLTRGALGDGSGIGEVIPASAAKDLPEIASATAAEELFGPRATRQTSTDPIYRDVMEHIRREPAQSTRLLETWIGAPSEDEE
jgi:flagellar M-ring protein FliF